MISEDFSVKCIDCKYARQDKSVSVYSPKHCKNCEEKKGCRFKKEKVICPKQNLKWGAFECSNPSSEHHLALLNVSSSGDIQDNITWGGCSYGVKGEEE